MFNKCASVGERTVCIYTRLNRDKHARPYICLQSFHFMASRKPIVSAALVLACPLLHANCQRHHL